MIDGRNFCDQPVKNDYLLGYTQLGFTRLYLFRKILSVNGKKSTAKTRCWSKSNLTN